MPPKIRPHDPQVRGAGLSGQASVGFRRTWSVLTTLAAGVARGDAPPTVVSYYDDIKPLFAVHCLKCHGPEKHEAGLRLDVREHALKGGESGVAILTGKAAESELIRRISSHDHDEQMPPKGLRLTTAEIADLSRWIDGGARWPDRDDYWAFQPLPREVPIPEGSASNPIDRFLSAKLSAAKIVPLKDADARTLLRRACFDLLGLPPTPEEAAPLLDPSPQSYSLIIDKLLSDSRYGERWARHWLDLVRYGESDGYEDDKIRPLAWRYRDYVIRSLNDDKPYDRFVQEQIAGDLLWPDDPAAWIATGFLRLGPWDSMSKEPEKQRADFLDDATDVTGAAFLGITLGCARCHDHKYDAISQRDYYAMQAFFGGLERKLPYLKVRPSEPASVTAAFQVENAALTKLRAERDALLDAARAALVSERSGSPGQEKPPEDAVRKRVDQDAPGQIDRLIEIMKPLDYSISFHEPRAETATGKCLPVRLRKGGELSRLGDEIAPGFPAAMLRGGEPAPKPHRTVLARWLTSPQQPLTARVIVNRVWQHHFGTGLVATPSDFGRNGKRPTHPELLDWLARWFVQGGWSLKKLHRLIMTSDAYHRASSPDAAAFSKDPENQLLWRFPRRRLEGEAIRDTLLAVSGTLNPSMGGPGIYAPLPKGINVEFPNNDKELSWGTSPEAEGRRRSIYLFQRRTLTFPLMEVFDAAPMNQSCAARPQTTVAPQALALFNGEFARECAGHFAQRLQQEAGDVAEKQVERAFLLAFTRPPTAPELAAALHFLKTQTSVRKDDANAALTDFCHTLLNASELLYAD